MPDMDTIRLSAGLSVSELSLWLEVPYSTVHVWCMTGRQPARYKRPQVDLLLARLQGAIQSRHFPMPLSIAQEDRRRYVLGIKKRA